MPQDLTIAKNLRRIMFDKGITQMELSKKLGVNQSTVACWMNGSRIPRLQNIDALAECLHVNREDIIGKARPEGTHYYNSETEQVAQEIMENHDLKALFDAARDISPEELKLIHNMALALKRKEQHEE